MIDLKQILTNILLLLKPLKERSRTLQTAYAKLSTTGNLTAYQTNYKISQFGGAAIDTNLTHQDYELGIIDTSGFTVRKPGAYYVTVNGHINASTTNFSIRVQLINMRGSTAVNTYTEYSSDPTSNTAGWAPYFCSGIIQAQIGDVISPYFYKYSPNNTTLGFRPSLVYFSIVYLGDAAS